MRNWNLNLAEASLGLATGFLLYLWGIETFTIFLYKSTISIIFTLPMRNWNLGRKQSSIILIKYFYFTYEELKFIKASRRRRMGRQIFTLPMRNWNYKRRNKKWWRRLDFYFTYEELKPKKKYLMVCSNQVFLLYLWGIETQECLLLPAEGLGYFYFTYEELKLYLSTSLSNNSAHIFTLPMRNWN